MEREHAHVCTRAYRIVDSAFLRALLHMLMHKLSALSAAVQIRAQFQLPDDLTEEEKLEPVRNFGDDPKIRLLNRLYEKKRKVRLLKCATAMCWAHSACRPCILLLMCPECWCLDTATSSRQKKSFQDWLAALKSTLHYSRLVGDETLGLLECSCLDGQEHLVKSW